MNVILNNIRARGLTLRKWTILNGFGYEYTRQVIANKKGCTDRSGKAREIVMALNKQGLMTPVKDELIWPSDLIVSANLQKSKGETK